ncbi:MAG: putative ABC exporter domain-containing protein [Longimicrobiales bacterium]
MLARSSLLSDFIWFMRMTSRNRLKQFLARMRSPRYAIALIIGVFYFGFIIFMPMLSRASSGRPPQGTGVVGLMRGFGPLVLLILSASWWLWRTDRDGITLSPAEANLLVPAPISRKQLIQFKLLGSQPGLLSSAIFMAAFTHASPLPFVIRVISAWGLFTTLQLHRFGASLVHTSIAEQGRSGWRRVWLAALLYGAMVTAILAPLVMAIVQARGLITMSLASSFLAHPPASYALAPFRAVMAATNAISMDSWLKAFPIALAIVIAHYVWVVRLDAAFEEGAADAGSKRAQLIEAIRAGKSASLARRSKDSKPVRAAWFPLPSAGEPTVAILWKNFLGVTRGISMRLLVTVASVLAFIMITIRSSHGGPGGGFAHIGGIICLSYGAMITFLAPNRIRHDFRSDLRRIEIIRTLPVGGTSLAAAEIATSAIVLTCLQFVLLGTGFGLLLMAGNIPATPLVYWGVPAAVLILIALNTTMIVIHNGAAIVFPAWAGHKPGGAEMFGLTMLIMLASLLLLVLSLIGPAVIGGVSALSVRATFGANSYIAGGIAAIITLYVQLVLMTIWLGRAYDRMDPTGRGGVLS